MVAWARLAASTRAPLTASRLLMASGSQSNISSSRCRPKAFTPLIPLCSIRSSTAPLLRRFNHVAVSHEKISLLTQNLFHCMVRSYPLQEKNAFLAPRSAASAAETATPPTSPHARLVSRRLRGLRAAPRGSSFHLQSIGDSLE